MSPPSGICISEVMYHPVAETSFDEQHEFIELQNVGDQPVSLAGYSLAGGIDFVFPPGESLAAGGFAVVAKNSAALMSLGYAGLSGARVFGDYARDLGNGGDTVTLLGPAGLPVDSVTYSDAFPWPISADALGAGESWLPAEWLPTQAHQYRGVSLERVSCASGADDPGNWVASPLDGATPGAANSGQAVLPWPVVDVLSVQGPGGTAIVSGDQPATINVSFSHAERVNAASVEFFADDISIEGEATQTAPLTPIAGGYSLQMPTAAGGTVVRYRILADRGAGLEVVSPRPSDPFEWHGYFVEPAEAGSTRRYHLFISPQNWTEIWDNVADGRSDNCSTNPTWQSRVPAVFAYEGRVYDVSVRYQGSRWNRFLGAEMSGSYQLGPNRPNPLLALSWRIGFPRYAPFEGRRVVILNKLIQGCPGYTSLVGFELFRRAGLPAPRAQYARLNVNGQYYHYMMDLERVDADLLERFHESEGVGEPLGHLFKSTGVTGDEGPWGWGDGRLLEASCNYSALERYSATYSRETHEWAGHDELVALIEGMHQARALGEAALRSYLEAVFDVDKMLNYLAVMNFVAPFDDMFQNYFLYQRRSDSKWFFIPWDLDLTFGGFNDAETSIFVGEEDNPDNRMGWFSYFKDSFFQAFRAEYQVRLQQLAGGILAESQLNPLIEQARAAAEPQQAEAAPAGAACDFDDALDDMQQFVNDRHAYLQGL